MQIKSFFVLTLLVALIDGKPPIVIPPKNPTAGQSLPSNETRKVLIIGGGLAGLSSALELADRGYSVTIKERDDTIGGRLATRPVQLLGQQFYVEHGFHAWSVFFF